ncbi:AraC family transcriptional regulator [Pseudoduganella namucuonensis]|uniref:AraC-type DNA-binding protein n=1 Tax=Pseudoduganella namucuonensis TaxID=1035707 RepID=A0A1I7M5P0_9BURK|nr:AraC family transcriptional regulator [Pseudoduganella namucuonensis]SFV17272.1 AraC-type DNA-binding protein [Pseudoduganella namucuonensis]
MPKNTEAGANFCHAASYHLRYSSGMEKGSVSIYFVHSALESLIARGVDVGPVLREAGLEPALLATPQARVSAAAFSSLWLAVARVLDDELFGQDSRRMKVGSFALLCQTVVHSATLGDGLRTMTRFFNMLLDDFHCALEIGGGRADLVIRDRRGGSPPVFGYETLLMLIHGILCWLAGRRIRVLRADFSYAEPSRSAEYRRMYCDDLHFGSDATRLSFDSACLALPVVQNAGTLGAFVRGAPANIVLKYRNRDGMAARVRRRLASLARTEWPDFETLAQQMHKAPSTLRRRLEDEGESFQSIKDQLRRDLAIDYLRNSALNVAEIAAELGFAEPSAFHRAFKKWTGAGPQSYRQRMLEGAEPPA